MRHRLEYFVILFAARFVQLFPSSLSRRLFSNIGLLYYFLSRRFREVALTNLKRVYPDRADEEKRKNIAKGSFRNLGRLLFDILRLEKLAVEDLESQAEIIGWEHLKKGYDRGKGVLLFSAHFGNWELVALLQGFRGYRLHMITRPLDNPYLERYLDRIRTRFGNKVVHKTGAIRKCRKAIRDGEGIAIVIDQSVPPDQAVMVDFLGHPAWTTQTLAKLALRFGCAVVPVFSLPTASGRYRIVYEPEVALPSSGDTEKDIRDLTQDCTRVIERYIKEHPEYWFWMHRRWRVEAREGLLEPPRKVPADD